MLAQVLEQIESKYKKLETLERQLQDTATTTEVTRAVFIDLLLNQFFADETFFRAYSGKAKEQITESNICLATRPDTSWDYATYAENKQYQALNMKPQNGTSNFLIIREKSNSQVHVYLESGFGMPSVGDKKNTKQISENITIDYFEPHQSSFEEHFKELTREDLCKIGKGLFGRVDDDNFSRFYNLLNCVSRRIAERLDQQYIEYDQRINYLTGQREEVRRTNKIIKNAEE